MKQEVQARPFKDRLFIESNSKFIQLFDTYMLLVIAYSCFTSAYYIAFSFPDGVPGFLELEHVVFGSYTLDIVFNFMRLQTTEGNSQK